jgi:hypothetical protein
MLHQLILVLLIWAYCAGVAAESNGQVDFSSKSMNASAHVKLKVVVPPHLMIQVNQRSISIHTNNPTTMVVSKSKAAPTTVTLL